MKTSAVNFIWHPEICQDAPNHGQDDLVLLCFIFQRAPKCLLLQNFCLVEKQNKENFVKKFRRFRNRENMWWAWPKLTSNTALGAVSRSLTSIFKLAKGVPKGTFSCNDTLYSGWLNFGASSLTSRMVMVISAGQVYFFRKTFSLNCKIGNTKKNSCMYYLSQMKKLVK